MAGKPPTAASSPNLEHTHEQNCKRQVTSSYVKLRVIYLTDIIHQNNRYGILLHPIRASSRLKCCNVVLRINQQHFSGRNHPQRSCSTGLLGCDIFLVDEWCWQRASATIFSCQCS